MNIDKYALKAESSFTTFEFISEGPKGLISKIVQFQKTNRAGVYNLAFGDKRFETGRIDDLVISDNHDSEKVLATVIGALYAFFDKISICIRVCNWKHECADKTVPDRNYALLSPDERRL